MVEIIINNTNSENAIRLLKRQGQIEGIFRAVKNSKEYYKPSEKKKRQTQEATLRRIRTRHKKH